MFTCLQAHLYVCKFMCMSVDVDVEAGGQPWLLLQTLSTSGQELTSRLANQ